MDTSRFRFIADALHAKGGFRPSGSDSYLVQYPRESDEKFSRRNQVAWYANDLASACVRFAGYLSQRRPMRDLLGNPLFAAFVDDCDWQGNNLDVFWAAFTVEAKARGSMLLLVDMPREVRNTPDDPEARAFPYLAVIPPELVRDIELDARGFVASVEIADGAERFRGWDATHWWVREGDKIIEQGEHPLGVCPVLAFAESSFPAEGEFGQIADLSKRLFNLRSELDEILRAQTFSLLTYQVPAEHSHLFDQDAISTQIGTNNLLTHTGQTPTFIAPPDGPARVYLDVIAQVEEKIRRIGHVVEAPDRAESGIALTIRFQQLNSALSHWAGKLEDLERRVWDLVRRWLGLREAPLISWDDDFALTDLKTEMDALASMIGTGFSQEALREKRRQILTLDFSTVDDDTMRRLLEAETEAAHERPVPDALPQGVL